MSLFRIKIIKIKIIIKILIIIFTSTCRWIEPFFTPLMHVFIDVKKKNTRGIKKCDFYDTPEKTFVDIYIRRMKNKALSAKWHVILLYN